MSLINEAKIGILKSKAKKSYLAYHREFDGLSCGKNLGEHVNPRMLKHKEDFNHSMDQLAMIDPGAPPTRL